MSDITTPLAETQALHQPAETLSTLLEATVAQRPDAPAIHHQRQCLSWREFLSLTRRTAAGLARRGLGPNDRLALWLPTLPEYLVLSFAAWRLGAVVVSVNTRFNSSELEHVLRAQRPTMLAIWPGFAEIDFPRILTGVAAEALGSVRTVLLHGADAKAPACLPDAASVPIADLADGPEMTEDAATPDSPCVTFTTSGTTRAPKFVLHRQRGITHHARDVARALGFDASDAVTFNPLPLCAVYGFTEALASIAGGAPQILMPRLDAAEAASLMVRHRVTHCMGTDDLFLRLLAATPKRHAFPTLRCSGFVIFNPSSADFLEEAERRGLPLIGVYGMSEVLALFAAQRLGGPPAERHRDGGIPLSPRATVRVRDEASGALLPAGEVGQLEISGPSLMAGYDNDPEATRRALTEDGFLRTGDLAALQPDGSFHYVSRSGDALRLGGFLVSPAEIEAHLEKHPSVRGVQVVGTAPPLRPCAVAFVILYDGAKASEEELRAFCAAGLARYKVPERIVAVDDFPVTRSGNGTKIQRHVLRAMAQALFAAPA